MLNGEPAEAAKLYSETDDVGDKVFTPIHLGTFFKISGMSVTSQCRRDLYCRLCAQKLHAAGS